MPSSDAVYFKKHIFAGSSFSQMCRTSYVTQLGLSAEATFGAYHESTLDLEVKVQGGHIRLYRTWQGSYRTWSLNPQHENLDLRHQAAPLSIIRRAVKWYQDDGTGIFRPLPRKDHPNAPRPDSNVLKSIYTTGTSPASCESRERATRIGLQKETGLFYLQNLHKAGQNLAFREDFYIGYLTC